MTRSGVGVHRGAGVRDDRGELAWPVGATFVAGGVALGAYCLLALTCAARDLWSRRWSR